MQIHHPPTNVPAFNVRAWNASRKCLLDEQTIEISIDGCEWLLLGVSFSSVFSIGGPRTQYDHSIFFTEPSGNERLELQSATHCVENWIFPTQYRMSPNVSFSSSSRWAPRGKSLALYTILATITVPRWTLAFSPGIPERASPTRGEWRKFLVVDSGSFLRFFTHLRF